MDHGFPFPPLSRSQYGEDLWIFNNINLPKNGTFLEAGACDGVHLSNTWTFERAGWRGVVVEPDPRWRRNLTLNRRCRIETCALGSDQKFLSLGLEEDPVFSGALRHSDYRINVPVKSIDQILQEHQIKDLTLLSLDTEGTELECWRATKARPQIVIIEYLTDRIHQISKKEMIDAFPNYRLVHETAANYIFSRS